MSTATETVSPIVSTSQHTSSERNSKTEVIMDNNFPFIPIDETLRGDFRLPRIQSVIDTEVEYYNHELHDEIMHARKFRKWAFKEIQELTEFKRWVLGNIHVPKWREYKAESRAKEVANDDILPRWTSPVIKKSGGQKVVTTVRKGKVSKDDEDGESCKHSVTRNIRTGKKIEFTSDEELEE